MLSQVHLPRLCRSFTHLTEHSTTKTGGHFLIGITNEECMMVQLVNTRPYLKTLAVEGDEYRNSCEMTSPPSKSSARHSFPDPCLPALFPGTTPAENVSMKPPVDLPPILRAHDVSRPFDNQYLQTRTSSLGGYGCFAAKDLSRGDVILRERPLLIASDETFYEKFGELAPDERAVFEALSISPTSFLGTPRIRATWRNNRFYISSTHSAIFPAASRFNHACRPACTISYKYDVEDDCLVMKVEAAFIPKDQELTISYGEKLTPMMLYLGYGFRCECGSCGGVTDEDIKQLEPMW